MYKISLKLDRKMFKGKNCITNIIRIFTGILFLASGLFKTANLLIFSEAIDNFGILPAQFNTLATVSIPTIEIICGIFLLFGLFLRSATLILSLLVSIFTLAIGIAFYRGMDFDCGCFGSLEILNSVSIEKIIFNLLLLLLLIHIFIKNKSEILISEQLKIISAITVSLSLLVGIPYYHNENIALINSKYIKPITVETAKSLLINNDMLILDARKIKRYEMGHIKDAKPLPIDNFNKYFKEYADYPKNSNILVYCDLSECTNADFVSYLLVKRGFKNIKTLIGGFKKWKSNN